MNDLSKISTSHLCRAACIYLRQSTPAQVEHNRESTQRQYALASKATTLGWPSQQVVVIDEDLGVRAMALPDLLPKSLSAMSALYSASKSRGSRATMPTGIAFWISAESPTPSSAMPMASIIRRCSTTDYCLASKAP